MLKVACPYIFYHFCSYFIVNLGKVNILLRHQYPLKTQKSIIIILNILTQFTIVILIVLDDNAEKAEELRFKMLENLERVKELQKNCKLYEIGIIGFINSI